MATDITLNDGDGSWVVIDANVVKATASDLMVDSPSRRNGAGGPHRRALVHNQSDGLTVNFAGDYPAGVTVSGPLFKVEAADLQLDAPSRRSGGGHPYRRALVHDQSDGLTVNFNHDYPGGLVLNGVTEITPRRPAADQLVSRPAVHVAGDITFAVPAGLVHRETETRSLVEELGKLQAQIGELTAQIADLAARVTALGG
jgi:hypothetical protein